VRGHAADLGLVAGEVAHHLPRGHVPLPEEALAPDHLAAAGERETALAGEGHRVDVAGVTFEHALRAAAGHVPQAHRAVQAPGEGQAPVRAEGHRADAPLVPGQIGAEVGSRRFHG
jgi:hypothetical protein